jgi:hypothetical protein
MQDTPSNYLENYFFELKREVDLEFFWSLVVVCCLIVYSKIIHIYIYIKLNIV